MDLNLLARQTVNGLGDYLFSPSAAREHDWGLDGAEGKERQRLAAMSPDDRLGEYVEGVILGALEQAATLASRPIKRSTLERYLRRIAAQTVDESWLYDPEAWGDPERTMTDIYEYARGDVMRALRQAAGIMAA